MSYTDIEMQSVKGRRLLCILVVILALNNAEFSISGLALQDIKVDLDLSDTELGLLTGIVFALFNSLMGVLIARWADHGNRVVVIAVTTGIWATMVVLSGLASRFPEFLLCRVGVAIGGAGCIPPALSLISNSFARSDRPKAVAIYWLGPPLGLALGYFAAGWVNQLFGWRTAFLSLGLAGLALAALASVSLKEPRTRLTSAPQKLQEKSVESGKASAKEVLEILWTSRTFRKVVMAFSAMSIFGSGITQWQATFFVRNFNLQTGELGTWFAAIFGLGGLLGSYCGGSLTQRYAESNERKQLRGVALAFAFYGIVTAIAFVVPNQYAAFALLAIANLASSATNGPLFSTIQILVPDRMRATSVALFTLFSVLIGMGLGPLSVGLLSDGLSNILGSEALRFALLIMCPGYLLGGWQIWQASNCVGRDIANVNPAIGEPAEEGVGELTW
jgi:MFS family permease